MRHSGSTSSGRKPWAIRESASLCSTGRSTGRILFAGARLEASADDLRKAPAVRGRRRSTARMSRASSSASTTARCAASRRVAAGLIAPIFADEGSPSSCSQLDIARAVLQAVEAGAHVINISAGQFTASREPDPLLARAIQHCIDRNVLIVAAVGNDGCDCVHMPAPATASVLSVGAMDATGAPIEMSNWGAPYRTQGVLAPGTEHPRRGPRRRHGAQERDELRDAGRLRGHRARPELAAAQRGADARPARRREARPRDRPPLRRGRGRRLSKIPCWTDQPSSPSAQHPDRGAEDDRSRCHERYRPRDRDRPCRPGAPRCGADCAPSPPPADLTTPGLVGLGLPPGPPAGLPAQVRMSDAGIASSCAIS